MVRPNRILITGATGYIGAVLVPMAEREGFDVSTLDLGIYERASFGPTGPKPDRRDIREVETDHLAGFDAIIHLAALSNDPLGNLDPELTYEINHRASVRLAERAKAAGVQRFLFASSCSLYGAHGPDRVDETAAFAPVTPYAETKVLVERDLHDLADEHFSPTYLRNATVYGTSPMLRLDVVVNNLTAWAVATGRILLQSDGSPWRPQVHVEDVARAFLALATAPREDVHDEAFNIGRNDENYQVRQLAEIVAEVVEGAELEYAPNAGPDTRSYQVDFSKIATRLPTFEPQWTVRSGVEQLASAFKQESLNERDFPKYTRLAVINAEQASGRLSADLRWLA